MLSQIERAQANPTVAVVWRLANALGVSIGELLGSAPASERPGIELVAVQDTPALRNHDGSCELRILGPLPLAGRFEWYQLSLQPGGALESQPHEAGTQEHLTLVSGLLEVQAGAQLQRLKLGETARYAVDQPHTIRNVGKAVAHAWLVVVHPG